MRSRREVNAGLWLGLLLIPWVLAGGGCKDDETTTATPVAPVPGYLDTSFAGDGIAFYDSGNGLDAGVNLAFDASGNLLVVGQATNAALDEDLALWRFTPDGVLDTAFGTGGVVMDDGYAAGAVDEGLDLTLDAAGNIVVSGTTDDNGLDPDMAVWRFTPAGARDTTFGIGGLATFDSGTFERGESLAIDSGGRILVAGTAQYSGSGFEEMTVWALTPGGALDTAAFAPGGILFFNGGFGDDFALGMGLAGGWIVTVGQATESGGNLNAGVWRADLGGAPDIAFGGTGHASLDGFGDADIANGFAVDPQGRYLVVGFTNDAGINQDIAVWRLNPDGSPDATFGQNGLTWFSGPAGFADEGVGIALQPVNATRYNILVTGYVTNESGVLDMVLVRFGDLGGLDSSFNAGQGYVIRGQDAGGVADPGFGAVVESMGRAVGLDPAGRIVVVGIAVNAAGDGDLAVWRFNP